MASVGETLLTRLRRGEQAWEALVAFLTASQLPLLLRVLTRHFDVFAVASERIAPAFETACRFSLSLILR